MSRAMSQAWLPLLASQLIASASVAKPIMCSFCPFGWVAITRHCIPILRGFDSRVISEGLVGAILLNCTRRLSRWLGPLALLFKGSHYTYTVNLNFGHLAFTLGTKSEERWVMYTHARHLADPEIRELRCMGGRWLKELREKRGLSQRGLAVLVGAEYYTFISQLETGRGRIPPDHYLEWAAALDVPPAEFVRELMKYYDPVTHGILFGGIPATSTKPGETKTPTADRS